MKASGIKALQNINKAKNVRRNSVFLAPEKVQETVDIDVISKEKRQLRNYWSSVDAAIFSITGHGGQQRLKRNIRRKTQHARTGNSDKGLVQSKESLHAHKLFNPVGMWKLLWDAFIGILIMYSVVIIPYRIGFEQPPGTVLDTLDWCMDILFAIDICMTFNTAVDDPQTDLLIVNRQTIALNYLSFWFWIDVVSTIPFDKLISLFIAGSGSLSSIRLIRVIRLTRLIKLVRVAKLSRLGNRVEAFDINPAIFGVQKMIIQIWFVAHLLGCFWHFLATGPGQTTKANDEINWVKAFGYTDRPVGEKYAAAFYYIITSMLAIGYGDIYATNTSEMIYAMMVMIIGSILFGAVIAQVNRLIESRNPSQKAFKNRMNELRAYLNEKNLPNVMRTKTTVAYRYYLRKKSAFDENEILNDLPTSLLSSLVLTAYAEYVDHIKIFKDLKKVFIVKLLVGFRPFQASVGEYVLKQNDVVEELIFIMKGLVQFSTSADGRETAVTGYSSDGGLFGDFEYYRKTNRILNYVAMASCNLVSTTTKHFDDAIASHPDAGHVIQKLLKGRYKSFLTAKSSDSYVRGAGVRVKTILWVDGAVKSGVTEDGDDADPVANQLLHSSQAKGKHVRILLLEDGVEEHMDEQLDKIFQLYRIIPPMLDTKIYWDLLIGVFIVYSIIIIPVQVGFSVTVNQNGAMFWFEKGIDIMFFSDMMISFRTAYTDDITDALVIVPDKIYKNYLKSWFVIDFFSTVPFDYILGAFLNTPSNSLRSIKLLKVSRLLRLLKLARFAKLRKYIAKVEDSLGISPVAFELGKMIIEVIFISHLTSCFYWYITTVMSSSPWYDVIDLRHADLESQYLTTLYWTITTLATVGYGDITPVNKNEQGVTIVIMLLGATVFGYIVSNVSALMGSFDLTAQRLSEKISEVEGYLSEKNVPDSLGVGVVKQIKHTFSQMSAFDESSILRRLPSHLSRQIISIKHAEALENIAILRYITNKGIILHLFSMMSPAFYDIDEPLLMQGSIATDIVFITRGKAQITKVTRHVQQHTDQPKSTKLNFKGLLQKHGGMSEVAGNGKGKSMAAVAMINLAKRKKAEDAAASASDETGTRERANNASELDESAEQHIGSIPRVFSRSTEDKEKHQSFPVLMKNQTTPPLLMKNQATPPLLDGDRVVPFARENSNPKPVMGMTRADQLSNNSAARPGPMLGVKQLSSLQNKSSTRQPLKLLQRNRNTRMETIVTHVPICQVGPGHFCGHVSLMTRQKIKASVIAILPCSVFLLSELDITMIVRDLPAVALTLKRAFAHAILAQRSFAKEKIRQQRGAFLEKMRNDFVEIDTTRKESLQARVRQRYRKLHTVMLIRRLSTSAMHMKPPQPGEPKAAAGAAGDGRAVTDSRVPPKPKFSMAAAAFAAGGVAAAARDKDQSPTLLTAAGVNPNLKTGTWTGTGGAGAGTVTASAIGIGGGTGTGTGTGIGKKFRKNSGSGPGGVLKLLSGGADPQSPGSKVIHRKRRISSSPGGGDNNNNQSTLQAIKNFSSKSFGVNLGPIKLDLSDKTILVYNSDDEDELDDMSYIKRSMPKKRSISCQVLGDSSVPLKLVTTSRRRRRLSFPSYDLRDWKEDRILNMMV
jgi:CRP-like cAMP-binding protein